MAKVKIRHPEFRHPPSTICGTGAIRILADVDDGTTAFLTSSQSSVVERVAEAVARGGGSLSDANHITKPTGEPTRHTLLEAANFLRRRRFDRIVAVGGGSVLDWARLAWALSIDGLDPEEGALLHTGTRTRFWLIPTTCATGAEAANVAVFQCGTGAKTAVVSPAFLAEKVVLDGGFLANLPEPQVAGFVCDALTHSIEASLSIVPLALGKEAAISAFNLVLSSFGLDDGSSRRDALMEAAFLGGVAAANCSVGIVHAFAHSVGRDGLPHGLANACALQAGLEFNAETSRMERFLLRVGARSVGDLAERVRPIVDCALGDIALHPVARRLQQDEYQHQVAARMARDVSLRSNARRASEADLLGFVRRVAERISAA